MEESSTYQLIRVHLVRLQAFFRSEARFFRGFSSSQFAEGPLMPFRQPIEAKIVEKTCRRTRCTQLIMRRGAIAAMRKAVASAGEAAFGAIPPKVESALAMEKDEARLMRIIGRIRTADSWENFLATP